MAFSAEDIFSFASIDPVNTARAFSGSAAAKATPVGKADRRMKTAAEEATRTAQSTVNSAHAGTMELGIQAMEAMRMSARLSLSHMEALMGVTSVSELVELQTAFLRRQAEFTVEQAGAMQESARKLAETVTMPASRAAGKETGKKPATSSRTA
jgi:hypothetical protein